MGCAVDLNFGDCFAYAHARLRGERLLTLDAGFLATELPVVLHPKRRRPRAQRHIDEARTMKMRDIPFGATDWSAVGATEHRGDTGVARWRTRHFGPADDPIRVWMVEYSPGYSADHWCSQGHVLLCLAGELETLLQDGRRFVLKPGMSYQVDDGVEAHRSSTASGATLFIVD